MKFFFITLSCILMMSNVVAQDIFVKKSMFSKYEASVEKNQIANAKDAIGGYPQLQTGEQTRVVHTKISSSTGVPIPLGRVTMFSERGKKLLYLVDTTVNLAQGASSDWVDEPCKREDFLWKRSIGRVFNDMNCASINHITSYFINPTGEFQQILVYVKDEGVEIPPTIIRATFTRYSSSGRRLVYFVDINPEQYGIDRDTTTPWGTNGWYKDFIKRDPKKVEFVEKLKLWATDVQDRMDDAFKKNTNAFAEIKKLDEYLGDAGKKILVNKLVQEQSTEEKLIRLKSLYEKRLLTEPQYNDQVKDVLSGK